MSERTFVDTNILIYAHDADAGAKQRAAADCLRRLWREGNGVLSPQVLQEFYVNARRKLARPLSASDARRVIGNYAPWCVTIGAEEIALAFRIEDEAGIAFWDALILAAASRAGAARLLSEDLNPGQIIAGVRIENPLA